MPSVGLSGVPDARVEAPRWGYDKQSNINVLSALEGRRDVYEDLITKFMSFRPLFYSVPFKKQNDSTPFWSNVWFSTLDAASLLGFIGLSRPSKYIEIGSGNSTKFAKHAIDTLGFPTLIKSVDPKPRAEIDGLCNVVIRQRLQDCDQSLFDDLEAGDILFFDGSHQLSTNSDVVVFFLEILPRLKNGVIVHVHDIFLPDDYPLEWGKRVYNEQYILASLLFGAQPPIKVLMPNYFVCRDEILSKQLDQLFAPLDGAGPIPKHYINPGFTPGVSFWFETAFRQRP